MVSFLSCPQSCQQTPYLHILHPGPLKLMTCFLRLSYFLSPSFPPWRSLVDYGTSLHLLRSFDFFFCNVLPFSVRIIHLLCYIYAWTLHLWCCCQGYFVISVSSFPSLILEGLCSFLHQLLSGLDVRTNSFHTPVSVSHCLGQGVCVRTQAAPGEKPHRSLEAAVLGAPRGRQVSLSLSLASPRKPLYARTQIWVIYSLDIYGHWSASHVTWLNLHFNLKFSYLK